MGGIPFKSTGCNTCRRRKVKCDEAKPECLRCVKNGHVCTGYERQRVFIHKSASTVDDSQKLVQRPKDAAVRSIKPPGTIIHVRPTIPRFDARPEIRSQLLASFIDCYLPPTEYLHNGPNRNLFERLPDLSGGSLLLDKAIGSLSSAFVAKQNRDERLLQYSTRLYSQAMELLQGKIKMGRGFGKDLLYTTILFQVYELINCSPSGFPAWLAHVQGSNAMIRQCDSRNTPSVAENLFLRQLRFVILCDAIGKRQGASHYNIPSRPEIPPGSTFEVEPIDEFIDILVECSTLLEKVDHFLEYGQGGPEQTRRAGELLLQSCLSLEEKLHNTCVKMQAKLGVPTPLPQNARILKEFRSAIPKDFFPEPLQFPSLTCAESHLIYWTTLVLIYPLIDQLLDFLGSSESPVPSISEFYPSIENKPTTAYRTPSPQTSVDFSALTDVYASEICRSVAYCLQPNMKALGGQMLLAPLSQSTQFFQVQESIQKTKWCQAVFMYLSQIGFAIGFFLKDMVWPQYRSSQKRRSPTPPSTASVETGSEFVQ